MGINMAHREAVRVMAEDREKAPNNRIKQCSWKEKKPMNATFIKLSALAIAFSMSLAIAPPYSQVKEKGKAKGKQNVEAKEKHGREAGELPYGIVHRTEKKGELPSGLQKKKDEDGQLTRGLEEGGKDLKSPSKGKKGPK
jgi:hypothetical protein